MKKLPILAITVGDPSGIGPEVVLKSLASKKVYSSCRPFVIGNASLFPKLKNPLFEIRPIQNISQAQFQFKKIDLFEITVPKLDSLVLGQPSPVSGRFSAMAVEKSVELALERSIHGIVHAPISKFAWKSAGIEDPGHTELIARLCRISNVAMAIISEPLRTVLVTRHIPLKQVAQDLKISEIVNAILLADEWLRKKGFRKPKIGICAFNPHGGEKGLLGSEESSKIKPAIQRARTQVISDLVGPIPADSAFRDHKDGQYDVLITMYHDQSLIPLKLFSSKNLVNITLGLPFVRTSPGHGTAFDIAGKNDADPRPMIQAILTAAQLSTP